MRSTGAPEGAAEHNGNGTIYSNAAGYETPIAALQPDQPGALDSRPGINFLPHLPGTAPGKAVIGSRVKLTFEATPASGQKVPERRVI